MVVGYFVRLINFSSVGFLLFSSVLFGTIIFYPTNGYCIDYDLSQVKKTLRRVCKDTRCCDINDDFVVAIEKLNRCADVEARKVIERVERNRELIRQYNKECFTDPGVQKKECKDFIKKMFSTFCNENLKESLYVKENYHRECRDFEKKYYDTTKRTQF